MHDFMVQPIGNNAAIMFCRKCGRSYKMAEHNGQEPTWQPITYYDTQMNGASDMIRQPCESGGWQGMR
jgi:hypothetical protein